MAFTDKTVWAGDAFGDRATGVLQDGGSDIVDDTQFLLFWSGTLVDSPSVTQTIFGIGDTSGTNIRIRNLSTGRIDLRVKDDGGSLIYTAEFSSTLDADGRFNIIVSMDTNSTTRISLNATNTNLPATAGETVELSASSTNHLLHSGSGADPNRLATTFARVAFWKGVSPDISSSAVRDNFFNSSTLEIVDPATSISAYGTPIIDIYGNAAAINSATNDTSGNANHMPLTGGTVTNFAGDHTPAHITRLGIYGGPRGTRSFVAKDTPPGGPHTPAHITRLGIYGGPRGTRAFVAKDPFIPIVGGQTTESVRFIANVGRLMNK